jgi:hypothetical protein
VIQRVALPFRSVTCGSVPDPFGVGRAVVVNVQAPTSGVFIGQPGTLTTRVDALH